MTRQWLVVQLACLAVLAVTASEARAAKSVRIIRLETRAVIERGGSLLLTETLVFRFDGGPFTSVTRALPLGRADRIDLVEAGADGRPWSRGHAPGHVEVSVDDDGAEVRWHVDPVSDAFQRCFVTYRLRGAVERTPGGDNIRWTVLGAQRKHAVADLAAILTWPDDVRLADVPALVRGKAEIVSSASHLVLTAKDVARDRGLAVALAFAPGSLAAEIPWWQARTMAHRRTAPVFIGLAAAIAVGGVLGLFVFAVGRRRTVVGSSSSLESSHPPDDLPAPLAGALLATGAGPAWPHALATFFELAMRGTVRVEERAVGRGRRQQFHVVLAGGSRTLRPHESAVLETLFGPRLTRGDAPLKDLGKLAQRLRRFARPLKAEMTEAGLLDDERERVRRALGRIGVGALVLGGLLMAGAGLAQERFGSWALLIGAAVELNGLVALVASAVLSPLSETGSWRAVQWHPFAAYVRSVAHGRRPMPDGDHFERCFPYAAAFGVAAVWARRNREAGGARVVPTWFHALGSGDEAATALSAMVRSIAPASAHSAS